METHHRCRRLSIVNEVLKWEVASEWSEWAIGLPSQIHSDDIHNTLRFEEPCCVFLPIIPRKGIGGFRRSMTASNMSPTDTRLVDGMNRLTVFAATLPDSRTKLGSLEQVDLVPRILS